MCRLIRAVSEEVRTACECRFVPPGTEIDVVVSGGGMRGYYVTGAYITLQQLARRGDIKVVRYGGTSAGAWCSIFQACDMDPIDWIETFYQTRAHSDKKLLDAYHLILPRMILPTLPADAYKRCSGRCHISISVLRGCRVRNMIVSEFSSNADLVDACIASSNIPFVATKGWGRRFRGEIVLDGGCTNNLPTFNDSKRPQLLFDLSKVAYPMQNTLSPSDPCVEALIMRGAIEMYRFSMEVPLGLQRNSITARAHMRARSRAAEADAAFSEGGGKFGAHVPVISVANNAAETPPRVGLLLLKRKTRNILLFIPVFMLLCRSTVRERLRRIWRSLLSIFVPHYSLSLLS